MRRSDANEEHEAGQERWLVSYADFITLMFAFFAVLYATAEKDAGKSREFQESIKKYLIKAGMFGGGASTQIQQGQKYNSVIEPPIPTFGREKPEATEALDHAEAFMESQFTSEERSKYIIDLTVDEWGVRIVLSGAAIFADKSEKFNESALPFLAKLSGLLAATKRKILVEGHVARGESGAFRSGWDFASARAVNMLRYIQKTQTLDAAALAAVSLGDSRPLFHGGKAGMNSRLEIVLLNSDMEL
ncbi:MAG: OmpA family protein [Calothrix sp. SM1_5_4]|nr:OmpA family protein [Calothrix sp. SM1_5_4]